MFNIIVLVFLVFSTTSLIFEASGKKPSNDAKDVDPVVSVVADAPTVLTVVTAEDNKPQKEKSPVDSPVAAFPESSTAPVASPAQVQTSPIVSQDSVPTSQAETSSIQPVSTDDSPSPSSLAVDTSIQNKSKTKEDKGKAEQVELPSASLPASPQDSASNKKDAVSAVAEESASSKEEVQVVDVPSVAQPEISVKTSETSQTSQTALVSANTNEEISAPLQNTASEALSTVVNNETPSSSAPVTTVSVLSKYPSAIKIISDKGKAVITWRDPESIDIATIEILRNAGGNTPVDGNPLAFISKGKESFVDGDVTEGAVYSYQLRARDYFNNQFLSAEYSVLIKEANLGFDNAANEDQHILDEGVGDSLLVRIVPETVVNKYLGLREQQGILESYVAAFGKLPVSAEEWDDVLRIATGLVPRERTVEAETRALGIFNKVFRHSASFQNEDDQIALMMIAYGLRPAIRDLAKEEAALVYFIEVFQKLPENSLEWDILRAITYYQYEIH